RPTDSLHGANPPLVCAPHGAVRADTLVEIKKDPATSSPGPLYFHGTCYAVKRVRRCDMITIGPVYGKNVGEGKDLGRPMTRTPLENRTVSRKTPGDGKLEITRPVADKLRGLGTRVEI